MKNQNKLINILSCFFERISIIFFVCIFIVVNIQVFFRGVIQISVPWTEELARYLGVWMVYIGVIAVVKQEKHLSVNFILDRLPKGLNHLVNLIIYFLILIFNLMIFWGSINLIRLTWGQSAVLLPISISIMYLAVGVSSFFSIFIIIYFIKRFLGFKKDKA